MADRWDLYLPSNNERPIYCGAFLAEGEDRIAGSGGWVDTYITRDCDGTGDIVARIPAWMVIAERQAGE